MLTDVEVSRNGMSVAEDWQVACRFVLNFAREN